jgi:ribosome-associated protein
LSPPDADEAAPAEPALVTPGGIGVPEQALTWRFSRASGPGGQHVNTSDTRVELSCDIGALRAPEFVLARLREQLGERVRIVAASERSQWRNRQAALDRLAVRLDRAAERRAPRRATRVPRAAVEQRLEDKRRQAARKSGRRPPLEE